MHNEEDLSTGILKDSKELKKYSQEDIKSSEVKSKARASRIPKDNRQAILDRHKQDEEDRAARAAAARVSQAIGGPSMLVPPEMGTEEEEMPLDTYTPDEQAMAEQVPDEEMEDSHLDFILGETLDESEQDYLMNALDADPKLNDILDKVVTSAS